MPVNPDLIERLPTPIGFVLGGGGSLGAAQVGMINALTDVGVFADLVTGTSIGAINGALVASDPTNAAARLSRVWSTLDTEVMMPGGLLRRAWTLLTKKTYIYDTPPLDELIKAEIGDKLIEDLPVPFAAMALDSDTGMGVRLDSGSLITAVLASSAIPGVFPPIESASRLLYDGGLVSNVPVLEALDMGAKSLVVLDCAFPDQKLGAPDSMVTTAFFAIMVQMRQQALRDMPLAAKFVPVLYLPGATPTIVSPLSFERSGLMMTSAYLASTKFLNDLVVDGPGFYRSVQP